MQAPTRTVKAYKLFRTLKTRPGEIFPLFIGKTNPRQWGSGFKRRTFQQRALHIVQAGTRGQFLKLTIS